jgi:hypothetical protein
MREFVDSGAVQMESGAEFYTTQSLTERPYKVIQHLSTDDANAAIPAVFWSTE